MGSPLNAIVADRLGFLTFIVVIVFAALDVDAVESQRFNAKVDDPARPDCCRHQAFTDYS